MLVEEDKFERLIKGTRVRKYLDSTHSSYKDGTVIKGLYYDGFAYVQWDNDEILDMSVNAYEVVILKEV